jgi:hypothetical protein
MDLGAGALAISYPSGSHGLDEFLTADVGLNIVLLFVASRISKTKQYEFGLNRLRLYPLVGILRTVLQRAIAHDPLLLTISSTQLVYSFG